MIFLPFDQFTIKTYLSPDEVRSRLEGVVEAKQHFRRFSFNKKHLPYEGVVTDNSFKVTRIIHYRNSFLPIISGEIKEGLGDTVVEITMKPNLFALIFIAVWLVIFLTIRASIGGFFFFPAPDNTSSAGMFAIGVGIVAFVYLLVNGSFQFEAIKSKKFFQTLFETQL